MTHAEFIAALGGPTRVARAVERRSLQPVSCFAVQRWQGRGVPHKYRLLLARIAAEQGVPVPEDMTPYLPAEAA